MVFHYNFTHRFYFMVGIRRRGRCTENGGNDPMADVVHARDDQSQTLAREPGSARHRTSTQAARTRRDRPRSDIGTLVIHWLAALAFFVSIFTGVRIAADDPDAMVSLWLAPITP